MNCLLHAYSAVLFSRTGCSVARSSVHGHPASPWNSNVVHIGIRVINLRPFLLRFRVQSLPSRKRKVTSQSQKLNPAPEMKDEKNAFFVVRKGDVVGVYRSLSECQDQLGSSICDPPVSVYKGYSLPKETEEYLTSCGLKNAVYSLQAADLKQDLFGTLVPCTSQQLHSFKGEMSGKALSNKRSTEAIGLEKREALQSALALTDPTIKHAKLVGIQAVPYDGNTCILEFDGACKGNPGSSGAGAVLRALNGNVICRLQEGLGKTTNNVAEYRAMILGLKYALKKGYECIRVQGDSKLACFQVQGRWKVKNKKISELYEAVKKLEDRFLSFEISHVLREFNSEADVQANLAVKLAEDEVHEEQL